MHKPKKYFTFTIAFILAIALSDVFIFASINQASINQTSIDERKVVVFQNNVSEGRKEFLLKKYSSNKLKSLSSINGFVVKIPINSNLKNEKDVLYIEDDSVVSIAKKFSVNPTPTPIQQELPEVIPWGIEWMGAPTQWNQTVTDNIKIAVLDTGICLNHPDLINNIKGEVNIINKGKSANDDNGHGSHVAGILAASINNFGVVGMIPDADLYAVKVLDSNGDGYVSDIIEGIDWSMKNNISILNMSFGTIKPSQALHDIIIKAKNAGITMVAAAGNTYGGLCEYPAAYSEVISVGSINKDGNISTFSAKQEVDVFAPGEEIYSTYKESRYINMDGTSMAAPHIVGQLILNKSLFETY